MNYMMRLETASDSVGIWHSRNAQWHYLKPVPHVAQNSYRQKMANMVFSFCINSLTRPEKNTDHVLVHAICEMSPGRSKLFSRPYHTYIRIYGLDGNYTRVLQELQILRRHRCRRECSFKNLEAVVHIPLPTRAVSFLCVA